MGIDVWTDSSIRPRTLGIDFFCIYEINESVLTQSKTRIALLVRQPNT